LHYLSHERWSYVFAVNANDTIIMNSFSLLRRGRNTLKHFNINSAIVAMSLAVLSNAVLAESALPTFASTNNIDSTQKSSFKNWTGFYAGLNAGGVFNHATLASSQLGFVGLTGICDTTENWSSVVFPGLQGGYAHQFGSKLVLGIEGDFTYNLNHQARTACTCQSDPTVSDAFNIKNQQQGSLRARIGYALPHNLLPYFTAGASIAKLGLAYDDGNGDYYSKSTSQAGWLAGAGVEWSLSHKWSVRAEYFYVNYGRALDMAIPVVYGLNDPNGGAHVNLSSNNVKLAVSYWL
jgi:outer membrane immunogenic protein